MFAYLVFIIFEYYISKFKNDPEALPVYECDTATDFDPPGVPTADLNRSRSPPRNLGCRLQVKTWYDRARMELIVTVLSSVDLPPRTGGQYR